MVGWALATRTFYNMFTFDCELQIICQHLLFNIDIPFLQTPNAFTLTIGISLSFLDVVVVVNDAVTVISTDLVVVTNLSN
jgi:hypothetical protein